MNRSTIQETSRRSSEPVRPGDRKEMPHWSGYLARLGAQVKKVATTPIWTGEPVSGEPAAVFETPRVETGRGRRTGHPSGDRRMSVEQRRELIGATHSATAVLSSPSVQVQEILSDYLSRTGTHPKQTESQEPGGAAEQGAVAGAIPHYGIRRPIGDRRTGRRQHRAADDHYWLHAVAGWFNFVPRLLDRLAEKYRWVDALVKNLPRASLGMWGFYFVAKLGLYGLGLIAFHVLENLLLAAFILLPVSSRILLRVKNVVTAVLAIALLYHDSWLPPIARLVSQASIMSSFSAAYLLELLARFVSWKMAALLCASGVLYWVLSRWLRTGVLVITGMLLLAAIQGINAGGRMADQTRPDMDKFLQNFFAKEAVRAVLFVTPQADATPFDVIFIHVCSLAWDDVRAAGLEEHALWARFDILLKNFNSAASYSGPAALHLMRAKCGQQPHADMYTPAADRCYLMNSLQVSGFEQNVALNHDGKFDDFLGQLKKHGRLNAAPLPLDGLDAAQYAFDKSPVYDDLAVLSRWLDKRQTSASARVALYYNTVSMHDGNHLPGTVAAANTLQTYKSRLSRFLDETESFLKKLEASGRRAVVVMVPEHGGAVRGDKRQIAGLREIPTPAISLVPVGIKVIGSKREGEALSIDQPTSYLAISYVVERMLEQSPYDHFTPSYYVENLPNTTFVSQNEITTVAEAGGRYYLSRGAAKWEEYSEFNPPAEGP